MYYPRNRYIPAHKVEGDARWWPFPTGHCQWCGKPLPRRCKAFCPSIDVKPYPEARRTYKYQECRANYFYYWYTIPRARRFILLRDSFTCQQCGLQPTATSSKDGIARPDLHQLHVDHIQPLARGGTNSFENLQLLCATCNLKKGAKIPSPG